MKALNILATAACFAAALLINGCASVSATSVAPVVKDTPAQAALRTWAGACYSADTALQAGVAYAQVHGLSAGQRSAIRNAAELVAVSCVAPPSLPNAASVSQSIESATAIVAAIAGVQVPPIQGK